MKIDNLKHKLKKSAITYGLVTVCVGVLFAGAYYYKTSIVENVSRLEGEKSSLQSMVSQKTKLYEDAKGSFAKYKVISPSKNSTATGLAAAHERLSLAIPIFNDLKNNYYFTRLNYMITATSPSTAVNSSIFDVVESGLNVDFVGISDEFILSFLKDIKYVMPGFLDIKTFEVSITKDITKETRDLDIASGKVEFIWRALKDKSTAPGGMDQGMPQNHMF
jgi:hypothetical protein